MDEALQKFRVYGGYQLASYPKLTAQKVHKTYLGNLRLMRASYLMEIFTEETNRTFKTPSVPFLFQSMFEEPKKALMYYPPMFNQKLANSINRIYNNPKIFANVVHIYLSNNLESIHIFAFSTFPSIYSFFLGEEFCSSASRFLRDLFSVCSEPLISEKLMISFLHSNPTFYDSLWMNIATGISKLTDKTKFQKKLEITKTSIEKSLPQISIHVLKAFHAFCAKYPQRRIQFFVRELLLNPFLSAADSSPYLTSPTQNRIFAEYLEEMLYPIRILEAETVLETFNGYFSILQVKPSMKNKVWSKGIPIILNDLDFPLIMKILSGCPELACNYTRSELTFTNDFTPIMFEIFPKIIMAQNYEFGFGYKLFGDRPPKVSIPQNPEFDRIWRKIESYANQVHEPLDEFVFKNDKIFHSDELKDYRYKKVLQHYEQNFSLLEETIILVQHLSTLKNMKFMLQRMNQIYYHHFAFSFLRQRLADKLTVTESLKCIFHDVVVAPSIIFEMSCIGLDAASFHVNKRMRKACEKFSNLLNQYMEKQWPIEKIKAPYLNRMKYILDTSTMLSQMPRLGMGKRLKIIITVVKRMKEILGVHWNNHWHSLFHFVLFASSCPSILSTFLIYHHLVFPKSLVENWGKNVHEAWTMFSTGMWYILKVDPDFCSFCSDYEQCKSVFSKKNDLIC